MNSTIEQLKVKFAQAFTAALVSNFAGTDPMLVPASHPKFADYQSNAPLSLGKETGQSPRGIAEQLVQHLHVDDLCQTVAVAEPGFINLTLNPAY